MKNTFYMNPTFYSRLSLLAAVALLAACSAATPDDKKAQLEKLKSQQADISKQVQQLEKDIAKENPKEAKIKTKDVAVTEVAPIKFDHYVQTQASVEAEDNIAVSPKSPGVVVAVYVKEGQQVSRGQALAQIDNSILKGSIESLQSQLELAKTVFERQQNLWNQKIGTEVQYLQAKSNKVMLERQLNSLQEQNNALRISSPIN